MKLIKLNLVLFSFLLMIACEKDNDNSGNNSNDIRLDIYAYNGNSLFYPDTIDNNRYVTTHFVDSMGKAKMNILDNAEHFYMYAKCKGYYTNIYYFRNGDSIDINLEPVETGKLCGVIFTFSSCRPPYYLSNREFILNSESGKVVQLATDDYGRFAIDYTNGDYSFEYPDKLYHNVRFTGLYHDIIIDDKQACFILEKPNIYLYPEERIKLNVELNFPKGGSVVKAIPEYPGSWKNITVEPSGIINGNYEYLFYESSNPLLCSYNRGWVIQQSELERFFTDNMRQTGFIQKEIDDFTKYWIPLFKENPYYAIFPIYNEEMDNMVELNFSKDPDNIIRLIYVIEGIESNDLNLEVPVIPNNTRKGFTVAEWGVVRK